LSDMYTHELLFR